MNFNFQIMSRILSVIAIVCWLFSLYLPALVFYSDQRLTGLEVLLSGWLSPLVGNIAWYANVFFIFASFRLQIGKKATISSIIAGILSVDTIRYTRHLLDEGGATTTLFGYGYGAVLWFIAISLIITSAGFRNQEERKKHQSVNKISKLLLTGCILLVIVLSASVYFSVQDKKNANLDEKERLKGMAFKRYEVCSAPEPIITNPIKNLKVLEVRCNGNSDLCDIQQLLSWGVPIVRHQGHDYSYESGANNRDLVSIPIKGAASATLYIQEIPVFKKSKLSEFFMGRRVQDSIHAILEDSSGRIVFDQLWRGDFAYGRYCPEYDPLYPDVDSNPRSLLIRALNIVGLCENVKNQSDSAKGKIVAFSDDGMTNEMIKSNWLKVHQDSKFPNNNFFLTNCPDDIDCDGSLNIVGRQLHPFMRDQKAYYLPFRYATCSDKYIYFYRGSSFHTNNYSLTIQKRNFTDFKLIGNYKIGIYDIPHQAMDPRFIRDNLLRMESIIETKEAFTFDLVNKRNGQKLNIETLKHGQPK